MNVSSLFRSLLLMGCAPLLAAPGDLDTTFGTGGKVTTDFAGDFDNGVSLALQNDGKILVAGSATVAGDRDFALARYTSTGVLDTSFGTGGKVTTPISMGGGSDFGTSVAVQSDGKILVAGYAFIGAGGDFVLVRYTDTGALDSNFGTGGIVITDFNGGSDDVRGMAVQNDGKILVAGTAFVGTNDTAFALVRYTDSGALDASFGTGGKVTTDFGSSFDSGSSVVVQNDGKILMVGGANIGGGGDFALVRYTATGALDTGFGSGGKVTTDLGGTSEGASSVALQSNGRILVAGNTGAASNNHDFALVRYTAAGALDTSFGSGGKVITSVGGSDDTADSVVVQGDGKILVAGSSIQPGPTYDFALVRYTAGGALDASFGSGGKVTTDFEGVFTGDFGSSVAVQGNGKLLVAGRATIASSSDFALVSYEGGPGGNQSPGVIVGGTPNATGAGLPQGTTFFSVATPDVDVANGKVQTPDGRKLDAVFNEQGTVLLRGEQMVAVDPMGGGAMGMVAKLKAPTGDAVLATLDRRSGATPENDQVLFTGLQSDTPTPAVRKGQEIPNLPGVILKSFLTLDGNGDTTFFSGKLKGTGVNGGNDTAIFAAGPGGFRFLVRKGMELGGRKVKIIATLVGQAGSLAEGRWRAGEGIGVRLTFTDRTHALYLIPAAATGPDDWLLIAQTGQDLAPDLPGALLQKLNLPAYAPGAVILDSLAKIGTGTPAITKRDNGVVFEAEGVDMGGPITLRRLAQRSRPVPVPQVSGLTRFRNVLAGIAGGSTLVADATLDGQRGARSTIFDTGADGTPRQIARLGDAAPGGGRFQRFVSVAKPDGMGYGALVSALLAVSRADGVTPANKAALYAVDSTGALRKVLRTGDQIESAGSGSPLKQVKSFVALTPAAGSIGAARGYDANGRVTALLTFTDRAQAVVTFQVP